MQKIKLFFFILCTTYTLNIVADGQYPKTQAEQKWDEVGSLAGGEGLIFRPGRTKNESTQTQGLKVNKYLWQSSIETLSFVPLASADSNGGVIITEWYTPKNKTNYRFKINLFIKDNIISPEAIEVKVFEEILKNNHWVSNDSKSNLDFTLEDKILRKARSLYIDSERKQ